MFKNPDNWPVESGTVKSVDIYDEGGCGVTGSTGWSFLINKSELDAVGVPPEVGEELIVLGGLGQQIRGIFIGDRQYRYVTRAEADRQREEWLTNYEREKEERFQANIADWIERKNALDLPFRRRIERFVNKSGFKEFWREDGGYELFTVEQANALYKIASEQVSEATAVEWLYAFSDASWDEQKRLFPGLDEGHSGNTFGGMVGLAKAVAEGKEI